MNVEVRERVVRTAYPRNGNAHNPTVYKAWDIYVSGRLYLPNLKFREASQLARQLRTGRKTP